MTMEGEMTMGDHGRVINTYANVNTSNVLDTKQRG